MMNSLKSLCSFAKCTPLALGQFKKEVEPLLGRELRVKLIVGVFGCLEASEDSNAPVHRTHCTTREQNRRRALPTARRYGDSSGLVASTARAARRFVRARVRAFGILGLGRSPVWLTFFYSAATCLHVPARLNTRIYEARGAEAPSQRTARGRLL